MAQRLISPFAQIMDEASMLRDGARLFFYASGTSTKLDTYSDAALTTPNLNPIILNEFGQPPLAVFGSNVNYKVVLAGPSDVPDDPPTNVIRTIDPVSGTDFATVPIFLVGSGSPNGAVAGTAASAGVLPTQYWDYSSSILYYCTTTGAALTAIWTALNASSSTPAVPSPQGRLTLTSGARIETSDITSSTSVYFTPVVGSLIPIYNGATFTPIEFTELPLSLVSSHAINTIYDVFVFNNSGVLTVVTGPAWAVSTAGSGARGTGSSTTQLTRIRGLDVNAVTITGRNGSTTYSIGANLATYVGSILIDGTAGQITSHVSYGQNRKRGVWNAYNRATTNLRAGDSTASWAYSTNTCRASNNSSLNSLTLFCGLAEEPIDIRFRQRTSFSVASGATSCDVTTQFGIGVNLTNAFTLSSQRRMADGAGASNFTPGLANDSLLAGEYFVPSLLGTTVIQANEQTPTASASSVTYYGGESNMLISGTWRA